MQTDERSKVDRERTVKTLGDLTDEMIEASLSDYHQEHYRWVSFEELTGAYLQQIQCIIIERPGGRVTIQVIVTPKSRAQSPEHYYSRFQRIPDVGFVQLVKRQG